MSSSISDHNPETTTFNTATERENLNHLSKFGLPANVAQRIYSRLILHDVHINDPTIASDVELHSWVLNCLQSYQLSQSFVVDYMLEVFCEDFDGWGSTEFSRLDRHIRAALKETLMVKEIYMGTANSHVNQRLVNLITDEQLPVWDETELLKYKSMYPRSEAWILLELHSSKSQQLRRSIETKIYPINNRRQQSFTLGPASVTLYSTNAPTSILSTKAPLAQLPPLQASLTPAHPIQVPTAQVLPIPAAIIRAPLSVPLAPSSPAEYGHGQPEMQPKQVKIFSDKIDTFTNKHTDARFSAFGQKEIQGLPEKAVFKVVTPEEVPSSIQVFNSRFVDEIKDLCIDKAYEKSRPVMHAYNDKEKNLVLMNSPKIPGVSPGICCCLASIVRDNDNDNIRFHLQNIKRAYVEIASDLNPEFYIRPLFKLISQLGDSFDSIVKVMRPLYGKSEADKNWFAIYHPHYKEKSGMERVRTLPLSSPALEGIISTYKATMRLEKWVKR